VTRFARYAWGVLGYNLLVIVWGAFVRATGSGAGCGSHWPLCNGEVLPRAPELETMIEFTHRLTSGLALLLVIGLFVWSRRLFPTSDLVRRAAKLSLVFIVIEALLGAGLVVFQLVADDASQMRAFSMVAHLVNTFILVAVLALTAWWATVGAPSALRLRSREAAAIGAGLVAMLAVGGTGAIAALGDTLFPAESLADGLRDSFSRESHPLIQLRKYHPLLAVLSGLLVAGIARQLARLGGGSVAGRLASVVVALYVTQLVAGVVNLILLAPVAMQLLHLLLADLVWIAFILFGASVLALPRQEPARASAATRPGTVRR
jgi:heme a synthase